MRKPTMIVLAASMLGMSFMQTGCFGNFSLVRKVYQFNDGVASAPIVKTIVFWVLTIIPVYGVAGFLDMVLFNLIEFWTGSNPIAMQDGEIEKQLVLLDGVQYEITATKNKMSFAVLSGKDAGKSMDILYTPDNKTWSVSAEGRSMDVCTIIGEQDGVPVARFNMPDGSTRDFAIEENNIAMFSTAIAETSYAAR